MPILVTGATGAVGGALVRQLAAAGHDVRALTRDPSGPAARALPSTVEVVAGDFDDPKTLVPALRGVARMHLVAMGGAVGPAGAEIVALAEEAGVRRLTHLGHDDFSRDDDDPLETAHRSLRRTIEASSMEWTHLFPGEFATNTREWAAMIRASNEVRAPFPEWRSALVHEADIAAVARVALTEDGHAGRVYIPTGPVAVRRAEAVRQIGEAIGREVTFVELTPEQAREQWEAVYPAQIIDWFLEMGQNPDTNAWVSPDVETVTGRAARPYAEWARDHAADFR
ncbi:NmrA family NAD(P)-binding protein [Catenuloplanes japonicus]|uniref:NmrA family NAD(P)-binding protein n=1 Tax=Catenuloplanes japonicus TaxID=33876 RepID=UPI0005278BE3|nr:NmrA family NAD(P)-binding protein [Catenuloplanes japonicus]